MNKLHKTDDSVKSGLSRFIITIVFIFIMNLNMANSNVGIERLWYKYIYTNYQMKGSLTYALFNPNGKTILLGSNYDSLIVEISASTGDAIRKLDSSLRAVSFSLDGKYFYTYRHLKIDNETLDTIGEYGADFKKNFKSMRFAANERAGIAIITSNNYPKRPASDSTIFIYDIKTFKCIKVTSIPYRYITNVIMPEAGNRFFIFSSSDPDSSIKGDEKKYISVWDINTLEMITEENISLNIWNISGNGNSIINESNNTYYIYDAATLKLKNQWYICNDLMFWATPSMTYDGHYFVTGALQGYYSYYKPRIWVSTTGVCTNELTTPDHESIINTVFNSNNHLLIIGGLNIFYYKTNIVSAQDYDDNLYRIQFSNSNGELHIELQNEAPRRLSVSLFDYMGHELMTNINNSAGERSISKDISFLPAGAYFLRLQIDDQIFTEKFIKE